MGTSILRPNENSKAIFHAFGILSLVLFMEKASSFEFKVGGPKGWTSPSNPSDDTYNQWAISRRFQIGDSLLFVYQPGQDSVVQVNKDDYDKCNTQAPIATFDDGNTSIKLNQSGPHYFISGKNCQNNEKITVVVLADRSNIKSKTNQTISVPPSSPPSPIEIIPSPAPSEIIPSPPPSEIIPSPPPTETSPPPAPTETSPPPAPTEMIPTPAPIGGEAPTGSPPPPPAPSGGSSLFVSFLSFFGAFVSGSSFLLVL